MVYLCFKKREKWKYEAFLNKKNASKDKLFFKSGYGREVLKGKIKNYLDISEVGCASSVHPSKRRIAGSSNGRTMDFGSMYLGSNPSPAATEPYGSWLGTNREEQLLRQCYQIL